MSCKLLLFFLFASLLFSCRKEGAVCIKSVGKINEETRTLEPFTSIALADDINLLLVQDTIEFVTTKAGKNLMNYVETKVDNGVLTIANKNKCNWLRSYDKAVINLTVHFKSLKKLGYTGSGDVTNTGTLKLGIFESVCEYASGTITLNVNADEIYSKVGNGTVDITVTGKANFSYEYSGGSGRIDHSNLISPRAGIYNAGTSFLKIYASQNLNVQLYNSGNIYYYGSPVTIKEDIRGTGELIAKN